MEVSTNHYRHGLFAFKENRRQHLGPALQDNEQSELQLQLMAKIKFLESLLRVTERIQKTGYVCNSNIPLLMTAFGGRSQKTEV